MADFYWTLHDAAGKDLSQTEHFDTKEQAEAFMGSDWQSLLDQGGESASLMEGDEVLYRMGLRET
jgi:hypothetical protein